MSFQTPELVSKTLDLNNEQQVNHVLRVFDNMAKKKNAKLPTMFDRQLDALLKNGESECVNILNEAVHDDLKFDADNKIYYYWDDGTKLWEPYKSADMVAYPLGELLRSEMKKFDDYFEKEFEEINKSIKKEDDIDIKKDFKEKLKQMQGKYKQYTSIRTAVNKHNTIISIIKSLSYLIIDKEFTKLIDGKNKHLLPLKNKRVIDLKTLEIRLRMKEDYFSFECPVKFLGADFESIHGKKFFNSMFNNDKKKREYFRMLSGYFCTGETDAKLFAILLGKEGYNGKSVYFNLMSKILNRFASPVHESVIFKQKSKSTHDTYEMALRNVRFGFYAETDETQILNTTTIKKVSGGDPQKLRDIQSSAVSDNNNIVFNYKLCIGTNTIPDFDQENNNNNALMERMHLIPLMVSFHEDPNKIKHKRDGFIYEQADPEWIDKLQNNEEHLNDIATYIFQGAYLYYNRFNDNGNQIKKIKYPSDVFDEDKNKFLCDVDTFLKFLKEYCISAKNMSNITRDHSYYIKRSKIFSMYLRFCSGEGVNASKKKFFKQLEDAGYIIAMGTKGKDKNDNKPIKGVWYVFGLKFNEETIHALDSKDEDD